ncbi:MAG: hypothetical protein J7L15_07610, partial [Clostridiales bacterium]|nr:hypothetical protein [Clostridiales bacterium]
TVILKNKYSSYYSSNRINEENGIYESVIFDGTKDLVKWDILSWQATEVDDTTVSVYIRTGGAVAVDDSDPAPDSILNAKWGVPYRNTEAAGVDLSNMSGQFIQFKIELSSKIKDVSPVFHRASIRVVTREAIHFFTTNFILPSAIKRGLLTSKKVVPLSADIVFGINTTNSIDWNSYQIVEENRIFNVGQVGENLRVGIKFITPNRSSFDSVVFDEYGPYGSLLYSNTVDFDFLNNSGSSHYYTYKVTFYSDEAMSNAIYIASSYSGDEGFSSEGEIVETTGVYIENGEESNVLFVPPGSANIDCNTYYFVKIDYAVDIPVSTEEEDVTYLTYSEDTEFITGCSTSFVDNVDFDFTNTALSSKDYHFRIKFYSDSERTNEYLTVFSGNDRSGWFIDDIQIPINGVTMSTQEEVNVVYRADVNDLEADTVYHLSIDAHDGTSAGFFSVSNSYTFRVRDVESLVYCGEYFDVPIVNNFGIMVELENNEFVTLNI